MSIAYGPKKVIRTAAAQLNHISSNGSTDTSVLGRSCDLSLYCYGSVQLVWSGLTAPAAIDATLTVEVSNDNVNWSTKTIGVTPAVISPTTGAGDEILSIPEITEKFYRLNWDKKTVTAGSITAIVHAKD